jgi:tetratricopeptide (TPR) repeat protein
MAVLYRILGQYDKSVECYNRVSLLLTRTELGLGDHSPEHDTEQSMHSCQRIKVAFSSQSIGDILFDTGEYSRALNSYDEALQLWRSSENDEYCGVAETLCFQEEMFY